MECRRRLGRPEVLKVDLNSIILMIVDTVTVVEMGVGGRLYVFSETQDGVRMSSCGWHTVSSSHMIGRLLSTKYLSLCLSTLFVCFDLSCFLFVVLRCFWFELDDGCPFLSVNNCGKEIGFLFTYVCVFFIGFSF